MCKPGQPCPEATSNAERAYAFVDRNMDGLREVFDLLFNSYPDPDGIVKAGAVADAQLPGKPGDKPMAAAIKDMAFGFYISGVVELASRGTEVDVKHRAVLDAIVAQMQGAKPGDQVTVGGLNTADDIVVPEGAELVGAMVINQETGEQMEFEGTEAEIKAKIQAFIDAHP